MIPLILSIGTRQSRRTSFWIVLLCLSASVFLLWNAVDRIDDCAVTKLGVLSQSFYIGSSQDSVDGHLCK